MPVRDDPTASSVEPVQVFIRVRPDLLRNSGSRGLKSSTNGSFEVSKCLTAIDDKTIRITPPDGAHGSRKSVPAVDDKIFTYDTIFSPDCTQEDVYERVSQHVRATIQGYNTTIFALGCTGSGKTYTMTGTSAAPGIIPRAISEIFSIIEATAAQEKDVFFYVRLSFVELYNNNFRNLLEFASKDLDTSHDDRPPGRSTSPTTIHPNIASSRSDKIEVRESQSAGVFLAGHNLRIPVTTAQEAFKLINRGNKGRATGSTQCNDISSRSHAILTLHVESRLGRRDTTAVEEPTGSDQPAELRLGKIHLVDLAGSERVAMSGAEGDTLIETQNINLSLTALGNVLSALSRNAAAMMQQMSSASSPRGGKGMAPRSPTNNSPSIVPVPYRDSKLTHLLKDSLGGNSKTIMITTVHMLSEYYHQTMVSLKYASRAKKVRNRSLVNRDVIGDSGIHAVSEEIERLRTRLDARSMEFDRLRSVQMRDAKENAVLKSRLQELHEANEKEKAALESQMSRVIHSQAGELASQKKKLSSLQSALQQELAISHNKIAEQEKEISWLKRALDETSQAVVQPMEQLERAQRVADAWQSQAKHSQEELESVKNELNELRSINSAVSNNLSESVTTNRKLKEDLLLARQKLEENGKAISSMKSEKESHDRELASLKEAVSSATRDALTSNSRNAELMGRVNSVEKELSLARSELNRLKTEYSQLEQDNQHTIHSLENENKRLKVRLNDAVKEIEDKLAVTVKQSSQRIADVEEQKVVAENKCQAAISEMEMLKRRLLDIHGNVEAVTEEREATISRLNASLESNECIRKELLLKFQTSEERNKELSREIVRLRDTVRVLEDDSKKFRRKFEEMSKTHSKELEGAYDAHRKAVEKLKKEHAVQLQELHDHSTSEIVKFRDDVSSAVMTQQETLSARHAEEIAQVRASFEAEKEEAVEIALRRQEEHLISQQKLELQEALDHRSLSLESDFQVRLQTAIEEAYSEWRAQNEDDMKQRAEHYETTLTELKCALENEAKSERERLVEEYEFRISELLETHDKRIETLRLELTAQYDSRVEEEREGLVDSHEEELQQLRAQHYQLMEESDRTHQQRVETLLAERNIAIQQHEELIEKMRNDHDTALSEVISTYDEKIKTLQMEHKAVIDRIYKNNSVERGEERIEMAAQHDREMDQIREELNQQFEDDKKRLQSALLAEFEEEMQRLKNSMEVDLQEAVDTALRNRESELEIQHRDEMQSALHDLRTELEDGRAKYVEESVAQAHAHFKRTQESRESALKSRHIEEIEALRQEHELRYQCLVESHEREIRDLKVEQASQEAQLLSNSEATYKTRLAENLQSLREEIELIHEKEISRLRSKLLQEQNAVTLSLQDEYESELHNKLTEMNANYEVRLKEELESLAMKHSVELDELRHSLNLTHDEELEGISAAHDAELEAVRRDANKEREMAMEALTKTYEERISALRAEMEGKMQVEKQEMRVAYEQDMEQLRESISSESMETIVALQSKHSLELQGALEEANAAAQRELESHLDMQEQQLRAETEFKLSELQSKLENESAEAIAALERQHRIEIESKISTTEEVYTLRIQGKEASLREELAAAHLEEMDALERRLRAQHAEDMMALQEAHREEAAAAQEHLESVVSEFTEKLEVSLREQKQEMDRARLNEIENILSERDITSKEVLSNARIEHEQEIARLNEEWDEERASLLAKHADDVNVTVQALKSELLAEYENSISMLKEEFEHKESSIKSHYESHVSELLKSHDEAQSRLNRQHEFALSQQSEELESRYAVQLREELATQENELHSMFERHKDEALQNLKASMEEQFETSFGESLKLQKESMEGSFDILLSEKLEEQKQELDEKHSIELEELRVQISSEHTKEMDSLRQDHEQKLANVVESTESALKAQHEIAIKQLESSLVETHSTYEKQLREQHEEDIKEMQAKHAAMLHDALETANADAEYRVSSVMSSLKEEYEVNMTKNEFNLSERLRNEFALERQSLLDKHRLEIESKISSMEEDYIHCLKEKEVSLREDLEAAHREEMNAQEQRLRAQHAEDVKALQEREVSLREDLEAAHREEMNAQEQRLRAQHAEDVKVLQEREVSLREDLEAAHREEMNAQEQRLRAQHAEDVKALQEREVSLREDLEAAHREEMNAQEQRLMAQHTQDIESLKQEFAETKFTEQSRADEALKNALNEQKRTMDAVRVKQLEELHHEMTATSNEFDRTLEELRVKHDAEIKSMTKTIEDMRENHGSECADITSRLNSQHEDFIAQLKLGHEAALKEQRENLYEEMSTAIASMEEKLMDVEAKARSHMSTALDEQLDRLMTHHQQEVEALKEEAVRTEQELREQLETLRCKEDQLSQKLEEQALELADVTTSHEAASHQLVIVERKLSESEMALQDTQSRYSEDILRIREDASAKLQRDIQQEQRKHSDAIEALKCTYDKEIEQLRDRLEFSHVVADSDKEQMTREYDDKIKELNSKHDAECLTMQENYSQEVEKLRQSILTLQESHDKDRDQLVCEYEVRIEERLADQRATMSKSHDEHVRELSCQIETLQDDLKNAVRMASVEEIEKRKKSIEEALLVASDEHKAELDTLSKSWRDEIMRVTDIHNDEITSLKIQTDRAKGELTQQIERLTTKALSKDQEITKLSERIEQYIQDLKSQSEEIVKLKATHKEQIQHAEKSYERSTAELMTRHKEELQSTKQMLQMTQSKYQALQEEYDTRTRDIAAASESSYGAQLLSLKSSYESEISTLKQSISSLESSSKSSELKAQKTIHQLSEQLKESNLRLSEQSQKHSSDNSVKIQSLVTEHMSSLRAKDNIIDNLEREVSRLQQELSTSKTQNTAVVSQHTPIDVDGLKLEFQRELSLQREQMQNSYLSLLQQQMESFMSVVHSQNQTTSLPRIEEMQGKFLSMIENLPDTLRNQLRQDLDAAFEHRSSDAGSELSKDKQGSSRFDVQRANRPLETVTWKSVTAKEKWRSEVRPSANGVSLNRSSDVSSHRHDLHHDGSRRPSTSSQNGTYTRDYASNTGISHPRRRSENSLYSDQQTTPIDQLIAAILDGDVQGIRSIVRSRGDSLVSDFWRDSAHTVLPLHRAISGLHFHGNDKLLIQTTEALLQLGAEVNAQDHAGNSAVHKAIQVCTSTSVVSVVDCLLKRGVSSTIKNALGQTPLHVECSRVRTATTAVIERLVASGCDVNGLMPLGNSQVGPLYLVLQRAAQLSVHPHTSDAGDMQSVLDDSTLNLTGLSTIHGTIHSHTQPSTRTRSSAVKCWVKAAQVLIQAGAAWDSNQQVSKGHTQLYFLLQAFPPPKEDMTAYRTLLSSCLRARISPLLEDESGRSALFVLCEQLACTSQDSYPEGPNILKLVLESIPGGGIGGSDRTGRTIFDIDDSRVPYSCLKAARQLLVDAGSHDVTTGKWKHQRDVVKSRSVNAPLSVSSGNKRSMSKTGASIRYSEFSSHQSGGSTSSQFYSRDNS